MVARSYVVHLGLPAPALQCGTHQSIRRLLLDPRPHGLVLGDRLPNNLMIVVDEIAPGLMGMTTMKSETFLVGLGLALSPLKAISDVTQKL